MSCKIYFGRFYRNEWDLVKDAIGKLTAAQKRQRAVELRLEGYQWHEIAAEAGYASAGAAHNAVTLVLRQHQAQMKQSADELRQQELEHLYMLRKQAVMALRARHVYVQAGGVVMERVDDTGEWDDEMKDWIGAEYRPIADDKPVLDAVKVLTRVAERISRLTGLDAPILTEVRQYDYRINGVDASEVG